MHVLCGDVDGSETAGRFLVGTDDLVAPALQKLLGRGDRLLLQVLQSMTSI